MSAMTIEVLLFAQLADALGARSVEVTVPVGATVGDALEQLAGEHDAIAAIRDQLAVAVDEQFAGRDSVLQAGQVVALIPPVSGG